LGNVAAGFYTLMKNVQNEQLALAAQSIGEAAAAQLTLVQVPQRQAFSDSLWRKQTISQRLAMLFVRFSAARHLV
jgi:alkylation response protein AidB-like acyl-CoA dehydrogenase